MHSLLKRQLTRHFGDPDAVSKDMRAFIATIDSAYDEFDVDRRMLERSLDLSSSELLQANSEMRAVFQAFPDLFIWLDRSGSVLSAQAGCTRDLYLSADRLVGKRIQDIPDDSVGQRFQAAFEAVRSNRRPVAFEYSLRLDDRNLHYEARLLALVKDQTLVIIRNITERKLAEGALAAEKELLAVTLRSITDGVITTDLSGAIVLMNPVAEELTGWRRDEASGRLLAMVYQATDESTGQSRAESMNEILRDGDWLAPRSAVLTARDLQKRTIADSASPIRDREGQLIGMVIVVRDIGEERRLQEEFLRASKLESIGTLAGGIAHDFNNLLTGILGYLSIAQVHVDDGSKIGEWLGQAHQASCRARELTQQLLTFSKGGAPVKEMASIPELIRESASFALRGSNVRCAFDIAEDLLAVEVDEGQISQVINNLIINANQAMPNGGELEIVVSNVEMSHDCPVAALAPGSYVEVSVRDEGIGISEDCLGKIFDPYFTTKQSGSGLGLATSFAIVKKHGGVMQVRSEVGVGTTFQVYLPAVPEMAALGGNRHSAVLSGGQGRVLVMDDELAVRKVAEVMLHKLGYDVVLAADGAEAVERCALERAAGRPIDAVLMDLTVPGGMGGREATERLSETEPDLLVLVSSGYSNDPIMSRFAEFGFSGVLSKPYSIQQLDQVLGEALRAERLAVPAG